MNTRIRPLLFWCGLILYVGSFFTIAVVGFGGPDPGYVSAQSSILLGIIVAKDFLKGAPPVRHNSMELFSLFVAAFINPLFLVYAIASPFKPNNPVVLLFRILVPLLIPFCWVVFQHEHFRPREGHFIWILGMLLVLFSGAAIRRANPAH